jgi:cell division protease FtsH
MTISLRNLVLWVVIVLMLLALLTLFQNPGQRLTGTDISASQFLSEVDNSRVRDVAIQGPDIQGTFTDGRAFHVYLPYDPALITRLHSKKIFVTVRPATDNVPWFISLLVSWLPFIALIGVWVYLSRGAGARQRQAPQASQNEIDALKRQIGDLQREVDRLKADRRSVP